MITMTSNTFLFLLTLSDNVDKYVLDTWTSMNHSHKDKYCFGFPVNMVLVSLPGDNDGINDNEGLLVYFSAWGHLFQRT